MIDILTAIIFVIFIWSGYKTGFLKSAYRVVAFAVGIALAYMLYPYVRNIIMSSAAGDTIRSIVQTKYVAPSIADNAFAADSLPGYVQSMVANGQIALSDAVSGFLSGLIINIISFLLIFIIVRFLIAIVGKLLHFVSKLPVISFFDRGLGVALGIVESVMFIYLILALVYAITPLRQNPTLNKYISESTLTKTMYENNPIVEMVKPTDYENLVKGG